MEGKERAFGGEAGEGKIRSTGKKLLGRSSEVRKESENAPGERMVL
jgi:hypothetical protein